MFTKLENLLLQFIGTHRTTTIEIKALNSTVCIREKSSMTMRRPYPFTPQYPYNMDMAVANQYYSTYDPQYNRKRQRRQAAAVVVESLWNNEMGRKSTAQPRPVLTVPPRGIGPIVDPNENDVLCGRGGRINRYVLYAQRRTSLIVATGRAYVRNMPSNTPACLSTIATVYSHSGNVQFRDVINAKKKEYLAPTTKKLEKAHIAAGIVSDIRCMDPPGRFLKEDRDTGLWFDIGDAKAIKKTGQALREDAPDIRNELEGDDSSGDSDNDKKADATTEKKSPKASPKPKVPPSPSLKQPQARSPVAASSSEKMAGQTAVWPQGHMPHHDYQAQMAMPPPYSNQMNNNYLPHYQAQMQGFETRNIPIQAPLMRQNAYVLPNQLYSGARSVSGKVASVSKHAMEALLPTRQQESPDERPPDDIAFGRPFHPPEAPTVLSSDNTMSTISGLSEQLSSNMAGSGLGYSGGRGSGLNGLDNMSLKLSNVSGQNSLRMSTLGTRGTSRQYDPTTMSGFNGSMRSANGSLTRSFSFPDMSSLIEGDSWRAIMEADSELLDEAATKSILSSESAGLGQGSTNRGGPRNSSAMSISGFSMDLASNASSTQWLAAAGLGNSSVQDDRTTLSGMSADLYALDLAKHDQFRTERQNY